MIIRKTSRAKRIFLIVNTIDISEEVKVLKVIRHIFQEVSRGCNQSTMTTSKGKTKW